MQSIRIGMNEASCDIVKIIDEELKVLKEQNVNYSIYEISDEESTSVVCTLNDDEDVQNKRAMPIIDLLKVHISNALAGYIVDRYEERFISKAINSNYCYFSSVEKKEIYRMALKILKNDEKKLLNDILIVRRRNVIVKKLLEYFDGADCIILDGFVNFRLKEYIRDLEEIVDRAVDDFLMEREYTEFIKLLRYFVEIQESKIDTVHIIPSFDGGYILLDDTKKEITNECIREFIDEISGGETNKDDLLVSSLITLAPKKLVMHSSDQFINKELLETIKNVFVGKVTVCQMCELCIMNTVKH